MASASWIIPAFLINSVSSIKVFHFSAQSSPTEPLSYLSLSPDPVIPLPEVFVFCISHQQSKMDNRGFYHLYGADGKPWMKLKFGIGSGIHNSVGLWGPFGSRWMYFGDVEEPKLYFWYHMCHSVDTVRGLLSVSLNGRRMGTDVKVTNLMENRPTQLGGRLVLGKTTKVSTTLDYYDEQFSGFITNVNVFSASNRSIDFLSSNACWVEGDVLAWSTSSWTQAGAGVTEKVESAGNICSGQGRYHLGLPVGLDQQRAVEACDKLGHGRMTVSNTEEELRQFVEWFGRKLPGMCSNIWTPYSDETLEGSYVSLEDGSKPSFLPWAPGQPNGANTENGIEIRPDWRNKSLPIYYYDQNSLRGLEKFVCSSCSLNSHFSLQLKGVCEYTFMGKISLKIQL